jgi:hypothetical protein
MWLALFEVLEHRRHLKKRIELRHELDCQLIELRLGEKLLILLETPLC